jgi:hypothetical protein
LPGQEAGFARAMPSLRGGAGVEGGGMKEHPILFSAPMVRALLADRKHVTRRLSKQWLKVRAGDRLWVRETLNIIDWDDSDARLGACVQYAASVDDEHHGCRGWTHDVDPKYAVSMDWGKGKEVIPSIFCPRWASRILLECEEDTRAERLQNITDSEAVLEGICDNPDCKTFVHVGMFRKLWDELHTKPGERWEDNPVVYRVGKFHHVTEAV